MVQNVHFFDVTPYIIFTQLYFYVYIGIYEMEYKLSNDI